MRSFSLFGGLLGTPIYEPIACLAAVSLAYSHGCYSHAILGFVGSPPLCFPLWKNTFQQFLLDNRSGNDEAEKMGFGVSRACKLSYSQIDGAHIDRELEYGSFAIVLNSIYLWKWGCL